MTRKKTWEEIEKFIPKDKTIWEPFYGNGKSGEYLRELGFDVIHENLDFFTNDFGDIIVTNPPFSQTQKVLDRLFELDKPFIIILPCNKICTQYFRGYKDKGIQLLIPRHRIQFDKIVDGEKVDQKDRCNFDCYFYCYKMQFKHDITWLN
jgi:hypothetical protein